MVWIMQYRTRKSKNDEWGEWSNLPATLLFSDYYVPLHFEFRAIEQYPVFAFTARQ
jgi:hypothetical protein